MSTVVGQRTVGEVMTGEVVLARPDTSFEELARLLVGHRISGLPVVDDDGKVMGVVSRTDLTGHRAGHGQDGPARRATVPTLRQPAGTRSLAGASPKAGELMTSPAVTVHPEQRVVDAARIMERRHIDRLPVVDEEDRLVGIATRRDLLRVFLRSDREILADVTCAVSGPSPAADRIEGLRIDVRDGMVTMTGSPEPAHDVAALIRAAWRVDGVVGVVNRLTARSGSDR
ncbi:CBS domain-containing protein [Streptomyces bambusae]|uniref:CBS domain-containing protein n=1 Tax=Streptomyces bambusae TaxID=1550616 RepID=UPI001CFFA398|nr:CBS domain-containing protein [Streptomyces bambusae]MCB5169445.1 CBS domain-containing protein [Streptomyces bambusae]